MATHHCIGNPCSICNPPEPPASLYAPMLPPPPRTPTYDPWRTVVDLRLDNHERRLELVEKTAECAQRTEKKVDNLTEQVMRVLDREATREPVQERDLGNMKAELAKTSASAGRKWGAAVGATVAGVVAVVSEVWAPFQRLIEMLK